MSLELVDSSKSYTIEHPSGAKFELKHWTNGMQEEVERQCLVQDGKGGFQYLTTREREIKIELALVSWGGVTQDGVDVPCNSETKKKLPVGVTLWIVRMIDDRAGLRMPEEEKKN